MDAECKAIEKKMQSEVDQFKSIQKGKIIHLNQMRKFMKHSLSEAILVMSL